MFGRLFLLFTLIPAFELYLLIAVGGKIGVTRTIAIIIITGVTGAWLARREGFRVWTEVTRQMQQGTLPGMQLVEALMILIAGALLVTPGFLTDIVGFALLIPPVRQAAAKALRDRFAANVSFHGPGPGGPFYPPGPGAPYNDRFDA